MTWPHLDYDATADAGDGPSVEEIAAAVLSGLLCSQCGEPYPKPHGFKVACAFCFARMSDAEVRAEGVRLATQEESTAEAFRQRHNRRKKA